MKQREVIISPEAEVDLNALYDFVSARSDVQTALKYISRISNFCEGMEVAAERGTLRNDLREGLRIVGFERKLVVAFTVELKRVVILRIFTRGQNWEATEW
jgi:toxin ParE1/3/4